MLWRRLALRTRILIGYGAGLLLMAALIGFLLFQLEQISRQVTDINANAAAEARLGAQLAARAAQAQQAVNRYLRQPEQANRDQANTALDALASDLALQQSVLVNDQQRDRAAELGARLGAYRATLQSIGTLLFTQNQLRLTINSQIIQANSLTTRLLTSAIGDTSPTSLTLLLNAQSNLQSGNAATSRMLADQSPEMSGLALASLRLVEARLKTLQNPANRSITLDDALLATTQAISATAQLADNLTALQTIRSTELSERSNELQRSADAIAQGALANLTEATGAIELQMRATERATLAALALTLLLAALLGLRLARALTRPLTALVAATERINQGDYDHSIPERDGGEIGQLVAAFNRMTGALRDERAALALEQSALAERNRELEQALSQLQRATAERETLASTVRSLSVPIIPILKRVLVAPLVGEIDLERANMLTQRLLEGVAGQHARLVILDITGVAMLDVEVASWLVRAATAMELLGARAMLAGVSPEVAQALVASGADLSRLAVAPDLRAAVEFALRDRA